MRLFEGHVSWVHSHADSHLLGKRQAIGVQIRNHDMTRARMTDHSRRHDSNRANPDDQYGVLAV